MWTIFIIQLLYIIWLIILRPFASTSDNFWEISNELFLIVFFIWVSASINKTCWTDSGSSTFIYLMLLNNLLVMIIVLCKLLDLIVVDYCCACCLQDRSWFQIFNWSLENHKQRLLAILGSVWWCLATNPTSWYHST